MLKNENILCDNTFFKTGLKHCKTILWAQFQLSFQILLAEHYMFLAGTP